MSNSSINLLLRFLLELTGLVALGIWGWQVGENSYKYMLAIGVPVVAAIVWGIFNVPGDPSRSGNAPVIVSGIIRLIIELVFFSLVTWALFYMQEPMTGWVFVLLVVIHYLASYQRTHWLLKQ